MEYTILGKTERRVSRIGFGGATAGLKNYLGDFDPDRKGDRDAILAAIQVALECGISYFDTAPGYGQGASEELFGEALANADPDSYFLATKVGIRKNADVRSSLEASLQRLRRDQLDLLQVHGTLYDADHAECVLGQGGLLDQMEALKSEGLILHTGITVEGLTPPVWDFIHCGRFDVLQVQYNVLFQHPYMGNRKKGLLFDAEAQGIGIVTMRSLTSGLFQRWMQHVNPDDRFDYRPALLQFQLSNPLVDVALLGMRNPDEVRENVRVVEDTAGRQDLDAINESYLKVD